MRLAALAGVVTTVCGALPVMGQMAVMPGLFGEDVPQVVCENRDLAIRLLGVYEENIDRGDKLLEQLAERGVCQRVTFAGKPLADVFQTRTGKQREGHVFEVEVEKGHVLKGKTKVYMLLYILRNEA
jgi:hypothetical protein